MRPRARSALVSVLVAVALAATSVTALVLARARTASAAASDVVEIHSAHGASFVPALQGNKPIFILALGSDARPGQDIERQRADSIHIIGINPAMHRATILGFPRDSWVYIPGVGTTKINTAMVVGGPSLMVRTLERLTGIHIDFWLLTSFSGLIGMVNGIGGLTVNVPTAMHDRYSGANFKRGTHHFWGAQALAFARDRHDFLQGDLTRSANQGRLFLAALSRLHGRFGQDPATVFDWIAVGWQRLRTDLDVQTILNLALTATQIPLSGVRNLVVPARSGVVGPADVVFISASASSIYTDLRKDGLIGS